MSVDILGTSWDQCRSIVQYSFTSTETRRLVRTDSPGRPPRLLHSSWTMTIRDVHLDFYTAPELSLSVFFFKWCFTSTETIRTVMDGDPRTATSTFTQLLSSVPVSLSHFTCLSFSLPVSVTPYPPVSPSLCPPLHLILSAYLVFSLSVSLSHLIYLSHFLSACISVSLYVPVSRTLCLYFCVTWSTCLSFSACLSVSPHRYSVSHSLCLPLHFTRSTCLSFSLLVCLSVSPHVPVLWSLCLSLSFSFSPSLCFLFGSPSRLRLCLALSLSPILFAYFWMSFSLIHCATELLTRETYARHVTSHSTSAVTQTDWKEEEKEPAQFCASQTRFEEVHKRRMHNLPEIVTQKEEAVAQRDRGGWGWGRRGEEKSHPCSLLKYYSFKTEKTNSSTKHTLTQETIDCLSDDPWPCTWHAHSMRRNHRWRLSTRANQKSVTDWTLQSVTAISQLHVSFYTTGGPARRTSLITCLTRIWV